MTSDANLTRLAYKKQSAFGTPPTGQQYQAISFVDEGAETQKQTDVSAEITGNRGKKDLLMLGWSNQGPTNHEFKIGPFDDFILEALAVSGWTTGSITIAGDITGNNTFTANASVAAAYTTAMAGSNNDLVFTAVTPGVAGNGITVALVDPPGNNVPISVAVVGLAITVTLATGGSSEITSTATQVKAAIDGNTAAAALITVANAGGDDGSGVVTALAATNLTGGDGGAFPTAAQGAKFFRISGASSNNNGVKRIATINSSTLTVDTAEFGTNENNVSVTFFWRYARNGSHFDAYSLEKEFFALDTPSYERLNDMAINEWQVTCAAKARILQTFNWMGTDKDIAGSSYSDGGTLLPEDDRDICTTSSHIGNILFNGTVRADVFSFNYTLSNNLRERPVIGSLTTLQHGSGDTDVTGTLEVYMQDGTLQTVFLNHSEATLLVPFIDVDGNVQSIYLPRIKSPNAQNLIQGKDTDLMLPFEFQALEDLTANYVIQIDRVDASA